MLDLQTYVAILLVVAAIGMYFIFKVIKKQINLFRITESPKIQSFRKKLFALSLVIVIMGLIPIGINVLTLFNDGAGRPKQVPALSLLYSAGVHLQSLLLSYILWRIYRLSDDQEQAVADLEMRHIENEHKKKVL
jgi:hypothetical protein